MDRDELLERAERVAVLVDAREPESTEPPWRSLFDSALTTALVTIVLGGWVGSCIAASIQRRSNQHALRLAGYETYLQERSKTVRTSIDLLGQTVAQSQSLISLSSEVWDPERFPPEAHDDLQAQRRGVREAFNEAEARWRTENISLGLRLSYYHRGRRDVREAWQEASHAVGRYIECAAVWEREHPPPSDQEACPAEEAAVSWHLASLIETIETASEYVWGPEDKP